MRTATLLSLAVFAALALSGCVSQQEVRESAFNDCRAKGGSADACVSVSYQHADNWQREQNAAWNTLSTNLAIQSAAMEANRQAQWANYYQSQPVRLQTNCMRVGTMLSCF